MENQEKEVQEVYSTKQTLRLIEAKIPVYAGVRDLVMVFEKDKNVIVLKGDQGTGKTSALRAILTLLGYEEPANAINSDEKTKKAELKFEKGDTTYVVNQTKTSFSITMESKDGVKSTLKSPKEAIVNLVGNVTMSPMSLKDMSGKKQIEWIRKNTKWSQQAIDGEAKVRSQRKIIYDQRTESNRQVNNLRTDLVASGFFVYDKENFSLNPTDLLNKEYADLKEVVTDEKEIKEAYIKADEKRNQYVREEARIVDLKDSKVRQENEVKRIQQDIVALQAKLQNAQNQIATTDEAIKKGDDFIADNKNVSAEFDKAQKDMMNFSNIQKRKEAIEASDKKFNQYSAKETESQELSAKIDDLDNDLKKIVAAFTPDIPGFEMVIGESIDQKREEGLYFNNRSMAELCESEMWEWFVPFLEKTNTSIVVIENVPSLGSNAVKIFNDCAKKGMYIFYTAMQREETKMKLEFLSEIGK